MQVNKNFITNIFNLKIRSSSHLFFILALCLLYSCIEEFEPPHNDFDDLLVINGSIIKEDSVQTVTISRSTPYNNPEFNPISNCMVWVENQSGQEFHFTENNQGTYNCVIPEQFLTVESQFKLKVNTPNGNEYESALETILENSPIDSIYFEEESYQNSSSDYDNGLQFYLDLKAPIGNSRNYRWKLEETWEYHTHVMYGQINSMDTSYYIPPKDTHSKCWLTNTVDGLYSSTTENLTLNEKKRILLNYVPESSNRLNVGYSLLVKQYVLSNEAYEYWNRHQVFINETGGLYEKQPSQSKSNIYNINDPDEIILGFFWISSYTQKRIFFEGPLGRIIKDESCELDTLREDSNILGTSYFGLIGFIESGDERVPIYGIASNKCFDCTLQGGTNIKPDFWK